MHLDIVLSLRVRATSDQGSPQPTAFRRHGNVDPEDSDYESDPELEIQDQGAYNEIENDRQDDSDAEDTSEPPARRGPSSQEIIPGAGRPLSDVVNYTELNLATTNDPWSAFSLEADFNLASWFVRNKVAKSQIDTYCADELGGTDARSFRSAYTMQQHLDELDPFGDYLVWTEAAIDDGQHVTTFYYRNVIDCVRFLIHQVAYRSEMVYAPVREYNSSGERLYSEMHTADWWWDTQV